MIDLAAPGTPANYPANRFHAQAGDADNKDSLFASAGPAGGERGLVYPGRS
jgi:hypothetical protein